MKNLTRLSNIFEECDTLKKSLSLLEMQVK